MYTYSKRLQGTVITSNAIFFSSSIVAPHRTGDRLIAEKKSHNNSSIFSFPLSPISRSLILLEHRGEARVYAVPLKYSNQSEHRGFCCPHRSSVLPFFLFFSLFFTLTKNRFLSHFFEDLKQQYFAILLE